MPVPRIEDVQDRRKWRGRGSRLWAEWCFLRACISHFQIRFAIMLILLAVGALLFITYEPDKGHTFPRAVFYTFSLIFGEPPEDFPDAIVLQALFFIVPILGLTVIIEGIIDFALILRDRRRFERSWCVMLSRSFKDHIILVGLGRLGYRTFLLLRRMDQPVVVIERDPNNQFLEEVRRDGSPLLIGDARRDAVLADANVEKARSIVLATNDDMANLEAALDARRMNAEIRVVLRMFDQNMADKVRDGFNINLAMSQSAISAPTFATCALSPATINSFIVGDQVVAMQRWLIRSGDPLCGLTIDDVMRQHHVNVIEYRRPGANSIVCPAPDTKLHPGDGLMLQGPVPELDHLRAQTLDHAVSQTAR